MSYVATHLDFAAANPFAPYTLNCYEGTPFGADPEYRIQTDPKWNTAYDVCLFDWDSIPKNKNLARLHGGTYFQTYGGGPAGGYVLKDGTVYKVHFQSNRGWSSRKLNGRLEFYAVKKHYTNGHTSDQRFYVRYVA